MHVSGAAGGAPDADREPVVSDEPDLRSTAQRTIVDLSGSGPFVSAGHYRYLEAQTALPLQLHSRLIVIALAIRSSFDFVVNERQIRVEPGQAIVIPPGNAYSTGADAQSRGELIWLVLRTGAASANEGDGWQHIDLVVDDLLERGVATCRTPQLSVELLTRVLAEADRIGPQTTFWRDAMCCAALAELWRTYADAAQASTPTHPAIRRATAWAAANIENPITVSEFIEASELSPTHFYDLFKVTYGTSPKDFILRMKIERAAELLTTSELSITEIAHRLGFSSSQLFGTVFRRYKGTSPSAYRERR